MVLTTASRPDPAHRCSDPLDALASQGVRSRWFTGEGAIRLHALVAGQEDRPAVLLLHGFPDFSLTWRHHFKRLAARGYHVVALDLRGAGCSSTPTDPAAYHLDRHVADVKAVAEVLQWRGTRVTVVAHDFGAHVAWMLAMRHAGLLERLSIINGVHPAHTRLVAAAAGKMRALGHVGLLQVPGLAEALLTPAVLVQVIATSTPARAFTCCDAAAYHRALSRPGVRAAMFAWYRQLVRAATCRPRLAVSRISDLPVTTRVGCSDPFLDRDLVAPPPSWVIRPVPSNLVCAGGHWLHWEHPDACVAEVPRLTGAAADSGAA